MSERVPLHDCLLLDTCCAINLFATPYAGEIRAALAQPVAIAKFVVECELLNLAAMLPPITSNLAEQLAQAGIFTVTLQKEEEDLFLVLASQLDDGEAVTAAIAMTRGWTIATDDRRGVYSKSVGVGRFAKSPYTVTAPASQLILITPV